MYHYANGCTLLVLLTITNLNDHSHVNVNYTDSDCAINNMNITILQITEYNNCQETRPVVIRTPSSCNTTCAYIHTTYCTTRRSLAFIMYRKTYANMYSELYVMVYIICFVITYASYYLLSFIGKKMCRRCLATTC